MHVWRSLGGLSKNKLLFALLTAVWCISGAHADALSPKLQSAVFRFVAGDAFTPELPLARSLGSAHTCTSGFADVSPTSAMRHISPRIFVQDTPPPALDIPVAARFEATPGLRSRLLAPAPVLRNPSLSLANRQRAP